MVLKIGIDQITRKNWQWGWNEEGQGEQWWSMDWVNNGPPITDKLFFSKDKKSRWNYGFNDFVIAECTPELASSVTGALNEDVSLPPEHPRAVREKTPVHKSTMTFMGPMMSPYTFDKHKAGYRTMAYGWGKMDDVLNLNSTVNQYVDVEGPEAGNMTGEPFVKFVVLPIPGGLKENNAFWIDLNKGLRALYFPARYVYHNDYPGDAAYAKISFVEEGTRSLISAEDLMSDTTFFKALFDVGVDPSEKTRKTATTATLNRQEHIGAYSFDSTLVVNIPKFIEQSFLVATNPSAAPLDALYLAKSADIKATKRVMKEGWHLPPKEGIYYWWLTSKMWKSYSAELSKSEQINVIETQTSDLGAGEEFALNVLIMAASLLPYVGPLLSTLGADGIEALKNVKTDADSASVSAYGIPKKAWDTAPSEAKEALVKRLATDIPKILKYVRRR